jgi:DNA-binding transcriptional ArsR family regulator
MTRGDAAESRAKTETAAADGTTCDAGSDLLDRTFAALAHPARRAMLSRLAQGPATATELGAPFAMSQPAVSKHLKVLEDAALITRGREAQWRPCTLNGETLHDVERWVNEFRRTWEERLDRLDTYIKKTQTREHPVREKEKDRD